MCGLWALPENQVKREEMMNEDEKYMDMALALAREGLGATYPNPK